MGKIAELVETVALVISRAEHGSLYPEFGAPDDVPVALHNLRAAHAVIPIVARHCAALVHDHAKLWSDEDVLGAFKRITTALETIGKERG